MIGAPEEVYYQNHKEHMQSSTATVTLLLNMRVIYGPDTNSLTGNINCQENMAGSLNFLLATGIAVLQQ